MADRSSPSRRVAVLAAALAAAATLAGCNFYDYGDHRRVHDLYPDYTDPPSRTILDLAPAGQPDVVQ